MHEYILDMLGYIVSFTYLFCYEDHQQVQSAYPSAFLLAN